MIIVPLFSSIILKIFLLGNILLNPEPSTAIVFPPTSMAPKWAWLSIPFAIPLTIVNPFMASVFVNVLATSAP